MINLLVIEDSTIKAMMADPRVVAILPGLTAAKKQLESVQKGKKNCHRCGSQKTQIATDAINQAKTAVRSLRGSRLTKLKQLLGARQLRIIASNGRGQRVKYTI